MARPGPAWFWAERDSADRLCDLVERVRPGGVRGAAVAHVGSADGARSLGIHACGAASVVGFEEATSDIDELRRVASEAGLPRLPDRLRFAPIIPTGLPADSDTFDVAVVDALSRLRRVVPVLQEVQRVLRPGGIGIFEVRPLHASTFGSGLPPGIAEPFEHLLAPEALAAELAARVDDAAHADALLDRMSRANRLTCDELQQSLLVAGFEPIEVLLETTPTRVPTTLQHRSFTDLAVSAVTVVARSRRTADREEKRATF